LRNKTKFVTLQRIQIKFITAERRKFKPVMELQRTHFNSDSLIQSIYENETHFVFFEHTFADNKTTSYPIDSQGNVPLGYNVYPQFSLETQAAKKKNVVARKWRFSDDQKTVSIINFK